MGAWGGLIVAGLAGGLAVFGFAPFDGFPLPLLALAVLFTLWRRAESAAAAAKLGFAFGLGLFGVGVRWLYVALHDYGGMAAPLAAAAIFLFAAFLALLPALAGYVQARLIAAGGAFWVLLMPVCWVAQELLRGYLFTGFPWLTLGYSQLQPSPLAGYAPLLGVYGVSFVLAVSACLLVWFWQERSWRALLSLVLIGLIGAGLSRVEWTVPVGAPLRVALVQGNIPQERKFEEGQLAGTLALYRRLVAEADAALVVLPETALPLLREQLPTDYVPSGKTVLAGIFEREGERYYNSVVSFGGTGLAGDGAAGQHYRKNHLVPFGEFIPLRPVLGVLINDILQIPMSDLSRGGEVQPPLALAGQQVALNICYEDVFGEEIIRALPAATLLVNVTNDAWYGLSDAAAQHGQISQMRALESGRMLLRATNTGLTAIIDRDGRIQARLPQHQQGILRGSAQGYRGMTPYARWGNGAVALLLLAAWLAAYRWRRHHG